MAGNERIAVAFEDGHVRVYDVEVRQRPVHSLLTDRGFHSCLCFVLCVVVASGGRLDVLGESSQQACDVIEHEPAKVPVAHHIHRWHRKRT
jgi:hypothetical protein